MGSFEYKGRDSQGNAVNGVLEAASEMAAAEQLMRRGVMPRALQHPATVLVTARPWLIAAWCLRSLTPSVSRWTWPACPV